MPLAEQEKGLKVIAESLRGEPGSVRAILKGQLTWPHIKQFQIEMNRIISTGCKTLEIDLGELTYLDSSGLAAFTLLHERLQQSEGSLRITNPRKLIRHIFVSAHLDQVLDIGPEKA